VASKERILRIHLVPELGQKKLDEIDNEIVQQLKLKLAHREPKTVNNILSTLNKMLKVAAEWRVIDEMPCTIRLLKVSSPEMQFYEQDQYGRLVCAARTLDRRKTIMVLLGGDAGLRRGEIIALRLNDVDHRRRLIRVERADWNGIEDLPKGGRGRVVPMTDALAKALSEHRHSRGSRVLYQDDGTAVTANTLQDWMEEVTGRAGLEPTRSLHILRHTFCSHLAMEGAAPKAIQELAGHRHLSTTMRYMHLTPAARESAIQLLDRERMIEKNEVG
jgi:integrase